MNFIENIFFDLVTKEGLWSLLTCSLFFYILKTQEKRDSNQEKREENYQNIISGLTENLDFLGEISLDIKQIKEKI